jgi:hypothetical protein
MRASSFLMRFRSAGSEDAPSRSASSRNLVFSVPFDSAQGKLVPGFIPTRFCSTGFQPVRLPSRSAARRPSCHPECRRLLSARRISPGAALSEKEVVAPLAGAPASGAAKAQSPRQAAPRLRPGTHLRAPLAACSWCRMAVATNASTAAVRAVAPDLTGKW